MTVVRSPKEWRPIFTEVQKRAKLVVAVLHNWYDFEDSLFYQTPENDGMWGDVAFVPYRYAKHADFVLVLNSIHVPFRLIKIASERLWFAVGEPPGRPHFQFHQGQGEGSTVITPDDSIPAERNARRYIHSPPITRSWWVQRTYKELMESRDVPKDRSLSWITSNFRNLEGHRVRMAFLDRLRKKVDFDLYGRGFAPLADKWDGLARYRYSIAFENTVSPLYFTEKLMDCFLCHTLPLYYGATQITKFFPEKAMVLIDPEDPNVIEKIRDISLSDLWRERLPYILEAKELVLKKYNMYARLSEHIGSAAEKPATPSKFILLQRKKVQYQL